MKAAERTGKWPSLMVIALPEDHTKGLKAGAYSPVAMVGSNDLAVGRIVEVVSHSKFWKDTAIFIIEDDAQNGPDHVDAHRTPGMVISPYVKRGFVDHTMYSTSSMLRTMEPDPRPSSDDAIRRRRDSDVRDVHDQSGFHALHAPEGTSRSERQEPGAHGVGAALGVARLQRRRRADPDELERDPLGRAQAGGAVAGASPRTAPRAVSAWGARSGAWARDRHSGNQKSGAWARDRHWEIGNRAPGREIGIGKSGDRAPGREIGIGKSEIGRLGARSALGNGDRAPGREIGIGKSEIGRLGARSALGNGKSGAWARDRHWEIGDRAPGREIGIGKPEIGRLGARSALGNRRSGAWARDRHWEIGDRAPGREIGIGKSEIGRLGARSASGNGNRAPGREIGIGKSEIGAWYADHY